MKHASYDYIHVVGFEETNLVGNVYYVNHLRWQGRCREMFLRDKAPSVLDDLSRGLALVTLKCSCEYLAEIRPFEEIRVAMRLGAITQSRITMLFEYWRGSDLVARGEQQIACMAREGANMTPVAVPAALRQALEAYV